MEQLLKEMMEQMNRRFDSIDNRLDLIEHRLNKVEFRLDKLDARLDAVETRLNKVEARLDKNYRYMIAKMDRHEKMFEIIASGVELNIPPEKLPFKKEIVPLKPEE